MEKKNRQIQRLTSYLLNKFGQTNIFIADYWDADNCAIGFTDKSKKRTAYISNFGRKDNQFFVSLENPPTSDKYLHSEAGDFDNLNTEDIENLLVKHLKLK